MGRREKENSKDKKVNQLSWFSEITMSISLGISRYPTTREQELFLCQTTSTSCMVPRNALAYRLFTVLGILKGILFICLFTMSTEIISPKQLPP